MAKVKTVGLILGREWSFPPAFIEEVAKRDAGVTLGIGKYIIPIPDGNHRRNSRQRAMPSQRWTKISARLIITCPCPRMLLAVAFGMELKRS